MSPVRGPARPFPHRSPANEPSARGPSRERILPMTLRSRAGAILSLVSVAVAIVGALQARHPEPLLVDRAHMNDVRARGEKGDAAIAAAIATLEKRREDSPRDQADVGDGQSRHASERRQARLHEPGAVLVAGSIQARRQAVHPQGRRAQPRDQQDHRSRQPRTAGRRGHHPLAGVSRTRDGRITPHTPRGSSGCGFSTRRRA